MKGGYYIVDIGELKVPTNEQLVDGYSIDVENVDVHNIDKPILLKFIIIGDTFPSKRVEYSVFIGMSIFYDVTDTPKIIRGGAFCGIPVTIGGLGFNKCALDARYNFNTKVFTITFNSLS